MGDGVLVVSMLCGGGFCVDSGGFSMGASVWVVVDFLWGADMWVVVDFVI